MSAYSVQTPIISFLSLFIPPVILSLSSLTSYHFVKLGRSRSSPSPPGGSIAILHARAARVARRRPPPLTALKDGVRPALDWSTSYQAGSSSSQSGESSSSESDDDSYHAQRKSQVNDAVDVPSTNDNVSSSAKHQAETGHSSEGGSPNSAVSNDNARRSRSPAVKALMSRGRAPQTKRTISPNAPIRNKANLQQSSYGCLLPYTFCLTLPFPWGRRTVKVSGDVRKAGENIVLLLSLLCGIQKMRDISIGCDNWIAFELAGIVLLSILYLIWTHLSYFSLPKALPAKDSPSRSRHRHRSSSPQVNRRSTTIFNAYPVRKDDFGYVWMTVPKNYRDSTDDGVLTALLLGPLISTACLYAANQVPTDAASLDSQNYLGTSWLIEAPITLRGPDAWNVIDSLRHSRCALVQLSSLTSSLLLVHLFASRMYEGYHRSRKTVPESERTSVPRSAWLRLRLYAAFAAMTTVAAVVFKTACAKTGIGIWKDLTHFDVAAVSAFYQVTLYMAIRLAHHSLTLGELGLVSFGAAIMFMESLHVTIARIWPVTTIYIKTFRLPTPLLILQLALIPGSISVGVLLAPLLYLSRRIAQRPLRKLRFPEEKQIHRRFLALGFYLGAALIVGGLIGIWTRWCLGGRDPWLWTIRWILQGRRKWTRPLLLAYWGVLACGSVAGWGRRLSRSRKYRHTAALQPSNAPGSENPMLLMQQSPTLASFSSQHDSASAINGNSGMGYGGSHNLVPILPNGGNVSVSAVANDLLDAADKRMPALKLNARRKFFHALAVIMFVPGIAVDPAFTHLSFSVAFAIFTFAEYLRYFALYPFGAAIHVFLTEFTDDKDNGTAILSHFYLLTGCASTLWLESHSSLCSFTGVLVLGVGDAMASIVGRRIGRTRWAASSPKTIEGSAAFVISVVASAWILRLCGLVEPFNSIKYTMVTSIAAILEALSVQNDNLTLPWYTWSMQTLIGVC